MDFHLIDLMSYPMWTLMCAIFFPIVAAIATFVCLKRAQTSKKLIGFFIIIPIFVALTVLICGDTGSIASNLLPPIGIYPVIGFLAAICLGIIGLNFTAVICGAGLIKRKGAIINTVASLLCLGINVIITFCSWVFANYKYKTDLYLKDDGLIDIREALVFIEPPEFIPDAVLDSGIELLALVVLAIFLTVYFLSFLALKTPEEIMKEDLERRRRAALENKGEKRSRAKKLPNDEPQEEERNNCCATCEFATPLKGDRTKVVCDKCGVVSASHVCRKYLYDPLKRSAFRPMINPLSPDNSFEDSDHI